VSEQTGFILRGITITGDVGGRVDSIPYSQGKECTQSHAQSHACGAHAPSAHVAHTHTSDVSAGKILAGT